MRKIGSGDTAGQRNDGRSPLGDRRGHSAGDDRTQLRRIDQPADLEGGGAEETYTGLNSRYRELIPALVPLLRPGGGIAVITNGTPMWLQDSPWSRALRSFLEQWLGTTLTSTCGTDDASQQRYRDTMTEAGLDVTETRSDYTDELDLDHLVGGVYSALPAQRLPAPGQRTAFADQIHRAVAPHAPFTEHVPVRILLRRPPQP